MNIEEKKPSNTAICNSFECNDLLTKKVEMAAKALWEAEYKPIMKKAGYSDEWKEQPRVIRIGSIRKAQIVLQAYSS